MILDKTLAEHKVLIFSQFKGMLQLLSDFLAIKGVKSLRICGDTPNSMRQSLIDKFNEPDYRVFLLSTRAGGLGLNLTQADTVIIFDSDFNPHNDQQALSRAHRIGQKNNVLVYRLVCKDSVEERIMEQAKKKLMLDTAVQQSSKEMVLKVLKFGTQKLFKQAETEACDGGNEQAKDGKVEVRKAYEIDFEALDKLLDRDGQFEALLKEQAKEAANSGGESSQYRQGAFDYLA